VLQAGVLDAITGSNVRVVLLVPSSKVEYFVKAFANSKVFVEGISIPQKAFEGVVMLFAFGLFNIHNRVVRDWKKKKWWLYLAAVLINNTLAYVPATRVWLRAFSSQYLVTNALDSHIEKYKPDLVVTTDSFFREDRAICITAKKRGIKTIAMIRSWDNATTKGLFLCDPDRIIVPCQVLKDELIEIHRIPSAIITVTGWPHYDTVMDGPHVSRKEFYATLGLDPERKTILYGPGGKILYQHDREVLVMLKRLVDTGAFTFPVQFLVRFPPGDTLDTTPIDGDSHFVVDKPGTNITGRKKESEMSALDNAHLEDSLYYADLVLTLVSTLAIDGVVFGKPVVILGFDVPGATKQSMSSFARRLHFKKFLNSDLLSTPRSETEFVETVNAYLQDPTLHDKERAEVVSRYAHALDGKSVERVSKIILSALE